EPEHGAGTDVAPGGRTAGASAELPGHVPLRPGRLAAPGQLTVTYVKPVPVGRPRHARAWLERREGRRWYVAGEMVLASTGAVLARGEAVMVARDPGHFARHQEWLAPPGAGPRPRPPPGRRPAAGPPPPRGHH